MEHVNTRPDVGHGRCPKCGSHSPSLHPAVQHEGEVNPCTHAFHYPDPSSNGHWELAVNCDEVHLYGVEGWRPTPGKYHEHWVSNAEGQSSIQRWGDDAQFLAEAMPKTEQGVRPQVHLLWMTPDPLGALAAMNFIYAGRVIRSLTEVTDEDRRYHWGEVMKAHLEAPLESIQFHFLIEGVDRAFTHQLVRQRTAAYAQESMRFAVKEDAAAESSTPPSIAALADDAPQRVIWDSALGAINDAYNSLVNSGIPSEDARGLLPHSTTTRIHYITNLRGLKQHAGNRLCTQAQFVWREVFAQIINAIRNYSEPGEKLLMRNLSWQYETIASSLLFRPVCYQLGRCPWGEELTRPCAIKERVNAFALNGVPSTKWEGEWWLDGPGGSEFNAQINPLEWLADSEAARKGVKENVL